MSGNIFLRFPEGKAKALTFSYDDGVYCDIKLVGIFKKPAQKIADRMSDDDYVVSSTKYLNPVDAENGAFSVYNNKPLESLPNWKDPYVGKKDELSFTRLVVGGNVLIHPALTDYREDYNTSGKMSEEEWKQYRDKKNGYRFEGQKYINQAMNELEKNYVDKFQEMIAKRLLEEYKNNK